MQYFSRVTEDIAQGLIRRQCPEWSDLPIRPVPSTGTSNTIFRLGENMAIRLPERGDSAAILKEQKWLPSVSPSLSLKTPLPLFNGKGDDSFSSAWSVLEWLPGQDLSQHPLQDQKRAAVGLGKLYRELGATPVPVDHPGCGKHSSYRGGQLGPMTEFVLKCIAECGDRIDQKMVTHVWRRASEEAFNNEPSWLHGDLHSTNILADNDTITSIIDFGLLAVGDPSCDLLPAWAFLDKPAREALQQESNCDQQSWWRSQGWGLYLAVMAIPYYWDRNDYMINLSLRILASIAEDER